MYSRGDTKQHVRNRLTLTEGDVDPPSVGVRIGTARKL